MVGWLPRGAAPAASSSAVWNTTKLGAGGQLTSIDIVPDATLGQVMVVRADTLGCYWYDKNATNPGNAGGLGVWKQMVDEVSLGPGNSQLYRNAAGGGWEIRIAPSLTTRFYMAHSDGNLYRTDNRGVSWTKLTTLPGGPYTMFANDGLSKFVNYKMAVDPNNADKVIVATPMNGMFITTNAGVSWAAIPQIPFGLSFSTLGRSTSSNDITAGSKTFTVTSFDAPYATGSLYWYVGQQLLIWQTSNPSNQLQGNVTSPNGAVNDTFSINVAATALHGSGSGITDWTVGLPNNSGENGSNCIVFFNSSIVYASTYGIGIWKSTDGGSSWSMLNSANMPTKPTKLRVDSAGVLYSMQGYPGDLTTWKYNGTAWSNVNTGLNGFCGALLAINPANPSQILLGDSGSWFYTTNAGTSISARMSAAGPRTATDIPYLATIVPFNIGNAVWGPDNIIYIADGVGVWKLLPSDISMVSNYHPPVASMSIGIEQLVINWIQSRPGYPVTATAMDRAIFLLSDETKYPVECKSQTIVNAVGKDIHEGYSGDWAANDASFSIALVGQDFVPYGTFYIIKSGDGGVNWSKAPSIPSGISASGGCVAAKSSTNWIWVEANGWNVASSLGGRLYYTLDGGTTWNPITTTGLGPDQGWFGPNANYSLRRQIAVADRVNGNFYLYNSGTVQPGIWRSTNNGATFTRVSTTRFDPGNDLDKWNCQLRPLPAYPGYTGGEFYATAGQQDAVTAFGSTLYECKDVGASVTMTPIAGTSFVWSIGIGKEKPGNTYPSIFIYGVIDAAHDIAGIGGQGVWRSDNHCATWTKLTPSGAAGQYVNHCLDQINVIEADLNVYGKCYVGFAGNGMMTYTP